VKAVGAVVRVFYRASDESNEVGLDLNRVLQPGLQNYYLGEKFNVLLYMYILIFIFIKMVINIEINESIKIL
jgi:hypothetical protein